MPVRRKSDKDRPVKDCTYLEALRYEAHNQFVHQERQSAEPSHDPLAKCWCCCDACRDLSFYHPARKGTWYLIKPNPNLEF